MLSPPSVAHREIAAVLTEGTEIAVDPSSVASTGMPAGRCRIGDSKVGAQPTAPSPVDHRHKAQAAALSSAQLDRRPAHQLLGQAGEGRDAGRNRLLGV